MIHRICCILLVPLDDENELELSALKCRLCLRCRDPDSRETTRKEAESGDKTSGKKRKKGSCTLPTPDPEGSIVECSRCEWKSWCGMCCLS